MPVDSADLPRAAAILERAVGARATVDAPARRVTAPTESGVAAIGIVAAELQAAGIGVDDLGLHQPTLDDVFLTLTGSPSAGYDDEPQGHTEPEEALR